MSTTGNDSNPGTLAQPWLTIQNAANTATAGATVNVMGGVYNAYVSFPNSGTALAPITFQSYPVVVGTTVQPAVIDGTGLVRYRAQRVSSRSREPGATSPSADLKSATLCYRLGGAVWRLYPGLGHWRPDFEQFDPQHRDHEQRAAMLAACSLTARRRLPSRSWSSVATNSTT